MGLAPHETLSAVELSRRASPVEHFAAEVRTPQGLTFEVIQQRFFRNPWFVAVDISFLIIALYHGLNGVRNIICDFSIVTKPMRTVVTVLLVLFGLGVAYSCILLAQRLHGLKTRAT